MSYQIPMEKQEQSPIKGKVISIKKAEPETREVCQHKGKYNRAVKLELDYCNYKAIILL